MRELPHWVIRAIHEQLGHYLNPDEFRLQTKNTEKILNEAAEEGKLVSQILSLSSRGAGSRLIATQLHVDRGYVQDILKRYRRASI